MAELYKIRKNGVDYDIKDSTARAAIEEMKQNGSGNVENGEDGFSPIAKVEQTATGAVISITDKTGITTATITNGKDGKDGTNAYIWVKYLDNVPTVSSDSDLKDTSSAYIGIYYGTSETAPMDISSYNWYKTKGKKEDNSIGRSDYYVRNAVRRYSGNLLTTT